MKIPDFSVDNYWINPDNYWINPDYKYKDYILISTDDNTWWKF